MAYKPDLSDPSNLLEYIQRSQNRLRVFCAIRDMQAARIPRLPISKADVRYFRPKQEGLWQPLPAMTSSDCTRALLQLMVAGIVLRSRWESLSRLSRPHYTYRIDWDSLGVLSDFLEEQGKPRLDVSLRNLVIL